MSNPAGSFSNIAENLMPLDRSVSGVLTNLNDNVQVSMNGGTANVINITGTWSGAIVMEASGDGTNWDPVTTLDRLNIFTVIPTITANSTYAVVSAGFKLLRARRSVATSGSATVTINISAGNQFNAVISLNPVNFRSTSFVTTKTAVPSPSADGSVITTIGDNFGRLGILEEVSLYTRWGMLFKSSTGIISTGSTNETPLAIISNPGGSGKNVRIQRAYFSSPNTGNTIYIAYIDPTITANGTALTVVGGRQNNQAASISGVFRLPTASALGTPFFSLQVPVGATIVTDIDFTQWIEPGHIGLITATQSSSSQGSSGVSMIWVEE